MPFPPGACYETPGPVRQLSWFLLFRVTVISLFLGGTILYQLYYGDGGAHPAVPLLYLLIAASYLEALISAVVLPRVKRFRLFVQVQVVWDLLFAFFLVYVTGGIDSPFSFFFLLIIVSAGFFLSRKEILFAASAAAILYGSLLDLQYYGYLVQVGRLQTAQDITGQEVFYKVFLNVLAFFLTAVLSGTLAERLRRSQRELEKREIDYEELEHLNRTMLAHIGSGLMVVNPNGRIRSFNRAATRITGYPLEEIYDCEVAEIFPELRLYDEGRFFLTNRGEGVFRDREGEKKILGYAANPVNDSQGKDLGVLVTFQDLTEFKKMEARLQRADRLAALGRLSAGMAHEIRNPLASISGSVQLLLEGEKANEEDRQLMNIVVREADRLNALLKDFLVFARPSPPEPVPTNVSRLLDEIAEMTESDQRFAEISLEREYAPDIWLNVDGGQLRQALWNLLINGAQAQQGKGCLRLGISEAEPAIYVDDAGPGIPEDIRGKIFDPFFTTKENGTGLGLATVFVIAQAHGGEVRVDSSDEMWTRVAIFLPGRTVEKGQT